MAESVIRLSVINDASPKLRVVDRDAKKLSNTVKNTNGKLNDQSKSLKHAALGFLGLGGAAKSATPALHGAGAALKGALAPILPLIAAGAALQQAFGTLVKQDFGETKYETLGGNVEDLTSNLRALTNELQGQHSVVQLTAASYDVASAGFIKAADAADVLKAASIGSTGGFSDLNTTGNALTSVLNAYGLEAKEATKTMDKFVQTQNDGKIVVQEYADNIGKVASVAATLNIPLSEVNAIIAQATAAGVKSEVAFTGLKTSMLKLVSTRGQKRLKEFGADISATTIEAEGLAANLRKLSGLGTQALTDIFGAEAIQVMAPILKDMEKFEELVRKQNASQGVASSAAIKASDTLQGQINRLGNAVINIFAEGTVLGDALKITIQGIAGTIEALGAGIKLVSMVFKGAWGIVTGFGKAIGLIKENTEGMLGPMQRLTKWWFKNIKDMETAQKNLIKAGQETGERLAKDLKKIISQVKLFGTNFVIALENVVIGIKHIWDNFDQLFKKALAQIKLFAENFVIAIKNVWIDIQNNMPDWVKWLFGIDKNVITPKIEYKILNEDEFDIENPAFKQFKKGDISTSVKGQTPGQTPKKTNQQKQDENDTTDAMKKWVELSKKLKEQFKQVGVTITETLADGIKGLIKGTQTLGEMLGNIANRVADMLLDIGIRTGLAAIGLPVPGFAAGGRPPVGKPSIVGEKGPELFVPRQAGTIIPNNQLGGGGSTNVVVNVDASGSSVQGDSGQAEQLGSMLGAAVQAEIARQQRPGGLLAAR